MTDRGLVDFANITSGFGFELLCEVGWSIKQANVVGLTYHFPRDICEEWCLFSSRIALVARHALSRLSCG